jgi:hypothetical protein
MSSVACSRSHVGLILCALALAGLSITRVSHAVEPPNPKDLIVGDWAIELDKSKFCNPAEAPKQAFRKIADEGYGMVSVHWTGIDASGAPIDRRYVYFNDGRKVPAGEFNEVPLKSKESMTFHLVNPHRVVWEHWAPDNKLTSTYVREISADGQTMTQTDKLMNRPGCVDVQVYRRQ